MTLMLVARVAIWFAALLSKSYKGRRCCRVHASWHKAGPTCPIYSSTTRRALSNNTTNLEYNLDAFVECLM